MPQSFLVFHLSRASLDFLFMVIHISTYSMSSLGGLVLYHSTTHHNQSSCRRCYFWIFLFLCLFCYDHSILWIISVMFLFRLSVSSCSSSAVNFFSVRVETCYSSFQSFLRVFLYRSFLLSALVFSVTEPITILWSLPMLMRFMTVTSVTILRFVSHDVVNYIFNVSIRAFPCPSPPCFLLKLCVHDLEIL